MIVRRVAFLGFSLLLLVLVTGVLFAQATSQTGSSGYFNGVGWRVIGASSSHSRSSSVEVWNDNSHTVRVNFRTAHSGSSFFLEPNESTVLTVSNGSLDSIRIQVIRW